MVLVLQKYFTVVTGIVRYPFHCQHTKVLANNCGHPTIFSGGSSAKISGDTRKYTTCWPWKGYDLKYSIVDTLLDYLTV
jgi:hypothetical protein